MKLHLITLRFVALTSLGCAPLLATAALYTGIYAFGDSLTDAGNTSLASGGASPGASNYNGRYSNGPVWVEDLAQHLGLPAMIPSLSIRRLGRLLPYVEFTHGRVSELV